MFHQGLFFTDSDFKGSLQTDVVGGRTAGKENVIRADKDKQRVEKNVPLTDDESDCSSVRFVWRVTGLRRFS